MITQKKIAPLLLTIGILSFSTGLILISKINLESKIAPASWHIQSILTFSIIVIGIGSYMAGSNHSRNKPFRYTMDFSKPK